MRPKGVTETAIAMCIMNIAGFVFVNPSVGSVTLQLAAIGIVIALTFVVLWYYWRGKSWARILVLVAGATAIFNVFGIQSVSLPAAVLIVIEAIFAIFMLWWLNTQSVRAYFKNADVSTQDVA